MGNFIVNSSFLAITLGVSKKHARDRKLYPVRKKFGRKDVFYFEYCTFWGLPLV